MQEKKFIYNAEQHLDEAGYAPYGKPEKNTGYANNMLKRVKTLKNMEIRAGKTITVTEINDDPSYKGAHLGNGKIALSKNNNYTFKSNMTLYLTLYHESLHVVYDFSPAMSIYLRSSYNDTNKAGTLAEWEHYLIFKEMNSILVNGTGTFGIGEGLNPLKRLFRQ